MEYGGCGVVLGDVGRVRRGGLGLWDWESYVKEDVNMGLWGFCTRSLDEFPFKFPAIGSGGGIGESLNGLAQLLTLEERIQTRIRYIL